LKKKTKQKTTPEPVSFLTLNVSALKFIVILKAHFLLMHFEILLYLGKKGGWRSACIC
jgi:hypothetical protein